MSEIETTGRETDMMEIPDEMHSAAAALEEAERLREENERLQKEIERVRELSVKERLYEHVHVSLRTLDIFIGVMIALGVFVIILGLIDR